MSDLTPYEQLGVTEESSFEEIQDARNRLMGEHQDDQTLVESIEAAYDAVLMDRLRLRQEGRIKVPERIRFPEKLAQATAKPAPEPPKTPAWMQQMVDTPSRTEILWSAGVFLALGALSLSSPSLALALAAGANLYLLNRKERKFGRAVLLSLLGLLGGIFLGVAFETVLQPSLLPGSWSDGTFPALVTMVVLWIVSSFLR